MPGLDQIIDLEISRNTSAVPRASFGIGAFIGFTQRSPNKASVFADLDEVAAVFDTEDPEYLAAQTYFSQSPRPTKLVIGLRESSVVFVPTATSLTAYTLHFEVPDYEVNITYTSDASPLVSEITAGLVAAINGDSTLAAYLTATDTGPGTSVTIATDAADDVMHVSVVAGTFASETHTPTDTFAECFAAVRLENDTFHCVAIHSRVQADIEAAAAVIAPLRKLFSWQCNDSDMITSATTDPGSVLQALEYDRVWGTYAEDDEYADMASMAQLLTRDPGSVTLKFKRLTGVTPWTTTTLDSTAQGYLTQKNINFYLAVGASNVDTTTSIYQEGVVASGEFVDVMRDVDYLHSTIQANVFDVLLNNDKVTMTDLGIGQIESAVRAGLISGVRLGILQDNDNLYVTVPLASSISIADRAARILATVKFAGDLTGAIHFVRIRGTVSV